MTVRTKVELGFNRIDRISGLDDLARVLFPDNRNHQRTFLRLFLHLKYAPDRFVLNFDPLWKSGEVSRRVLEIVRAKCRKLGLIDHVSKFTLWLH